MIIQNDATRYYPARRLALRKLGLLLDDGALFVYGLTCLCALGIARIVDRIRNRP